MPSADIFKTTATFLKVRMVVSWLSMLSGFPSVCTSSLQVPHLPATVQTCAHSAEPSLASGLSRNVNGSSSLHGAAIDLSRAYSRHDTKTAGMVLMWRPSTLSTVEQASEQEIGDGDEIDRFHTWEGTSTGTNAWRQVNIHNIGRPVTIRKSWLEKLACG